MGKRQVIWYSMYGCRTSFAANKPLEEMAENVLVKAGRKLGEQLNCSICLDIYTDPKLLQCFHIYCRQCLVPLVVRDQEGQLGINCPTCRQVTPIPERGVAGLQPAFHINHLLEIQQSLQVLEDPAATPEHAVGGATINTPPKDVAKCCFEHTDEELKLFCETCGVLICYKCALKGGKHCNHEYEELNQAFEGYKEEILSSLELMEKQVTNVLRTLVQLDKCRGEISNQRAATADDIHVNFRQLRQVLDVRETELIGKLDQLTQEKLKGLAAKRDQIETTLARLNSCLHFMRGSVRAGNKGDVLMKKASTVEQVKELTTPFQPDILELFTEADLLFHSQADARAACQNFGKILSAKNLPDPLKCQIMGTGLEAAVVGEESTVILRSVDFKGVPCKEPIKLLQCDIVSDVTGSRRTCSVERRGRSEYEISYQPAIKGRNQLFIKAEGQHVIGSPFSVAVMSPVEKLGAPISAISGVDQPWGVAVNKIGEVLVSELSGHCVTVFSPTGDKIRSFGSYGSGHGQFDNPCGVAVDGKGNILVADCYNHRIQVFTADGQFLMVMSTKGCSKPIKVAYPAGIAFNTYSKKVYVVENARHHVQILNSDLTFFRTFGKEGSGKGQFKHPCGVACNSTGKVYVADTQNYRIQVFTAEGKFLSMFGWRGQGKGELDRPDGVAIDTSDMVYVSESRNHRVSVFTPEGQFVTSFGSMGKSPGKFECPHGLVVDSCGEVYVCDGVNNRVQCF